MYMDEVKREANNTNTNTKKKDYKKRGLLWLIAPFCSLICILFIFGITSYIFQALGENYQILGSLVRVIIGLCGLVAVALIIIGIPLGILNLNKKEGE